MKRFLSLGLLVTFAVAGLTLWAPTQVGDVKNGEVRVPTGQTVLDSPIKFAGRPVDLALDTKRNRLYIKENRGLSILDVSTQKLIAEIPVAGGASLTGLIIVGDELLFSDAGKAVHRFDLTQDPPKPLPPVEFPAAKVGGNAYPCGLADLGDGRWAVALSRSNAVAIVRDTTIEATIPVEAAPFSLAVSGNRLVVACWGQFPSESDPVAKSAGTEVAVDARGIARGGSICEIDLRTRGLVRNVRVGAQPSGLRIESDHILFTEAGSDRLCRLDPGSFAPKTLVQFETGASPTSLTRMSDGRLVITCGGSNRVAVLDATGSKRQFDLKTGWYPLALIPTADALWVANSKGIGSRALTEPKNGRNVYQFTGTIDRLTMNGPLKPEPMPETAKPRKDRKPQPIPERPGEPSPIRHVFYVLKENRTYDQVFGDLPQGDGDPSLCIYPRKITPNHHALAEQFVLLDNYYCNGVLSADGHSWSTEANASSYFERSFGGWTRSYPYGDDPIAISQSGHIWDRVLDKGLTFRNYGEYNYATPDNLQKHNEMLTDLESGARKARFKHNIGIARLRKHSNPNYPGWNMNIPDVVRADVFIREFKSLDASGKVPNFSFIYLPQDHASGRSPGMPTPNSHLADNDLALGRVVEAISKSKVWGKSAIFVMEDDPQDGFDHVDGHRSICLVVSPYTKRGKVVSQFYNQAAVLKTIGHILGTPPLGKFDRMANAMTECFQAKADLRPFTALKNQVPLNELNPSGSQQAKLDLSGPDRLGEDFYNRILWGYSRPNQPYPAHLAGAHGTGLKSKGLRLDGAVVEAD
jgi:hypothetical protein